MRNQIIFTIEEEWGDSYYDSIPIEFFKEKEKRDARLIKLKSLNTYKTYEAGEEELQ